MTPLALMVVVPVTVVVEPAAGSVEVMVGGVVSVGLVLLTVIVRVCSVTLLVGWAVS